MTKQYLKQTMTTKKSNKIYLAESHEDHSIRGVAFTMLVHSHDEDLVQSFALQTIENKRRLSLKQRDRSVKIDKYIHILVGFSSED